MTYELNDTTATISYSLLSTNYRFRASTPMLYVLEKSSMLNLRLIGRSSLKF